MTGTRQESFQIAYRSGDRYGQVKLREYFDFMQEIAANHAEALGVGYHTIVPLRRLWVLNRLKLHLSGAPEIGDKLEVLTYPTPFHRLFASRQFLLTCNGREIGRASSFWLFLDADTLRPVRLAELPAQLPDNSGLPVYFDMADKLPRIAPEEAPFTADFSVRWSMEDVNGHLNNAEYACLVQDALAQWTAPHRVLVREVELVWHAAARAFQTLRLAGKLEENGAFLISGYLEDGTLSFSARGAVSLP